MQDFVNILSNFGFPVAVASYLLFRFEKKLEMLETTNHALKQTIDDLLETNKTLKDAITQQSSAIVALTDKLRGGRR